MKTTTNVKRGRLLGGVVLLAVLTLGRLAAAQVCVQPPEGLVSWWPGDGTASDIVGSADGTLHGGATFTAGLVGQAFSFDGIDGFSDFGTAAGNFGTADFTVDLWVNFRTMAASEIILEKYIETFSASRTGWGAAMLPPNTLHFYGPLPGEFPSIITTPVPVAPNAWNLLAVTRETGAFTLYWNGVVVGSNTIPSLNLDSTAALKLAHRGSPNDTPGSLDTRNFFLDGMIDEVEIFNRALTASEIQAIFNAGPAGKCKVTTVKVDIKPGSFPNSINPRSKGVIPVAILTTDTFDATTVDPATVLFGATGTEAAPVQSALEDVDGDGDTDLILHFNTQATGIQCGDTSASLTGETLGGQMIEGSDSINTVGCK